jgi:hypothetical protein
MAHHKPLTVTAVQDENGMVTAFFDKFPGLVVQGKSINDVHGKLSSLFNSYKEWLSSYDHRIEIQTQVLR